ncbi:MAG: DNA-methyltransferase, partial [archaeon]
LFLTNIIWQKSQISNRCSWGSFASPSAPSFPTPFEYIMIFSKETKTLQEKKETDITKEEFIKWSLALWKFPPETNMKKIKHPAAFPIEMPMRLIKMLSWVGCTVLDPFSGSGTTGQACMETNRNYIGIEMSEEYHNIAAKRLKNTKNKFENQIF